MTIAPTLQKYLAAENIQYEVIPHEFSMTSTRTAEACHIPGDRLAKGIVLRRDGEYMLAVLPASHHLRLPELQYSVTMFSSPMKPRSICCSATVHTVQFPLSENAMGWISSSTTASRHSRKSIWKLAITRRCFIWVTLSLRA